MKSVAQRADGSTGQKWRWTLLILASSIIFVLAKNWTSETTLTLDRIDLWIQALIPIALVSLAKHIAPPQLRNLMLTTNAEALVAWSWFLSLVYFVISKEFRLFDAVEELVRHPFGYFSWPSKFLASLYYCLVGAVLARIAISLCTNMRSLSLHWLISLIAVWFGTGLFFAALVF